MDRRGFLQTLIGGVAVGAAVRTFPFRVYSFASDVVLAPATALKNLDNWSRIPLPFLASTWRGRRGLAGVRMFREAGGSEETLRNILQAHDIEHHNEKEGLIRVMVR